MNFRDFSIPKPASAPQFEALCLALYQKILASPLAQKNGVKGQSQQGVDIFGRDAATGALYGVQCKVRAKKLTFAEIEKEVDMAETFEPRLQHFVVATTADRDSKLQAKVGLLSESRTAKALFSVHVVGWDDVLDMLDQHRDVAARFYPNFAALPGRADVVPAVLATTGNNAVFAQRLTHTLTLLNEGRTYDQISISQVAEILNAERISDVSKFFDGREEPPIKFMREFSQHFGIYPEWLLHGHDEAFYCPEPSIFSPIDAIPFLERQMPEEIYFVRSKSEFGECVVAVRLDHWRYVTFNGLWHVSGHVGGTGTSQMVDLCRLILYVLENKIPCRGFLVEEQTFNNLKEGEIYPGAVFERSRSSAWWLCLLDIEYRKQAAPHYRQSFGQEFLDAQQILRKEITSQLKEQFIAAR